MTIGRRGLLAGGAALLGAPAFADTYPSKQIRWVIPFAPGGNYDVTSRLVAEPMGRDLGQTVLIDNKPGAGGVVGLENAVQAPADGYTIVMASFTVAYVAPIFAGKQQMLQVLAPVSILTTAPTLIVTRADSRFTLSEGSKSMPRLACDTIAIRVAQRPPAASLPGRGRRDNR